MTKDEYVKEHFPEVDCGVRPTGNQLVVQLRTVKKKSGGGIVLVEETREFNKHNTQMCRVIKLGQIAFRHRETGEEWKEGAWAEIGDVVVMPRYGGFTFSVPIPGTDDTALFAIYADYEVKLVVESNFAALDKLL